MAKIVLVDDDENILTSVSMVMETEGMMLRNLRMANRRSNTSPRRRQIL